ncbi:hypothetical protein [Methylocaldum sp.]|uniref:hypothetical protein n=1 Tax=Methylocaldum sp. TaxID=1969727 RepID=UPI002D2789C9|nr:hypothetical protein [Methylocaldum sp.]HYE34916.1 hypothetical protein [Methylocaldum sp.]
MATKVIEPELSKPTFATLWKHVKCILRMHVSGILDEAETISSANRARNSGNIGPRTP